MKKSVGHDGWATLGECVRAAALPDLTGECDGKRASQIASELRCDTDTALHAINAFNRRGVAALTAVSTTAQDRTGL